MSTPKHSKHLHFEFEKPFKISLSHNITNTEFDLHHIPLDRMQWNNITWNYTGASEKMMNSQEQRWISTAVPNKRNTANIFSWLWDCATNHMLKHPFRLPIIQVDQRQVQTESDRTGLWHRRAVVLIPDWTIKWPPLVKPTNDLGEYSSEMKMIWLKEANL